MGVKFREAFFSIYALILVTLIAEFLAFYWLLPHESRYKIAAATFLATTLVNTVIEFVVARLFFGKLAAKKLLYCIFLINSVIQTIDN